MKRKVRIQWLLWLTLILASSLFVTQLYSLEAIKKQVNQGLELGIKEITKQVADSVCRDFETKIKSTLFQADLVNDILENQPTRNEWIPPRNSYPLAEQYAMVLPDFNKKEWRIFEHLAWENRFANNVKQEGSLSQIIQSRLSQRYRPWESGNEDFWENRIDSILVIYDQSHPFLNSIQILCQPVFDPNSDQFKGFICIQTNRYALETEWFPTFFQTHHWSYLQNRKDGIHKDFIFLKIRNEHQSVIYQNVVLAQGRIEGRVELANVSPYLSLYQIEMGFWGKDSQGVAESLHRRNVLMVGVLFVILFALLSLIYLTIRKSRRLDELKNHFLANITHELKTPMASVKLAADTLMYGRAQTETAQQSCLNIIQSESEKLNRLLTTLLDFSQLEAGKVLYKTTKIWLPEWWEKHMNLFEEKSRLQGITLIQMGTSPECFVMADPDALRDIIDILIDNAIKYSGDSKVIHLHHIVQKNHWAFCVEDFGIGIKKEDQKLIFDKFVRLGDSEIHNVKGYGLGLSIAQSIVKDHKGYINVESQLHAGSRFTVGIPAIYHGYSDSTAP